MLNLPDPYNNLDFPQLASCLKALRAFKESEAYLLLVKEYTDARDDVTATICEISPASIGEFVAREQAVGQLVQLKIILEWTDAKIEELNEIINKIKQNEE